MPTAFYWKLTLLSTLGGFLFGYDTSNIGAALNFVPYHLTGFWPGYLVAGASLGAAVGALLAGPMTDRFGRKQLLVVDAGIYAAGAILSAVTPDAPVLLFARTLIGLAIGADSAIATAYIAEYAPKGRRGVAGDAAAVDDHGRDPRRLRHRAHRPARWPASAGTVRLAADPRPRRGPGAGRAGAAHPDARVAALAAAPRPATRTCRRPWPRFGIEVSADDVEPAAAALERARARRPGGRPGRRACAAR